MNTQTTPALFAFVKLTVTDIDRMTRFFIDGFGLTHADTVDTPEFREHMMTGKQGSTTVVLFHWKDARAIDVGNGWGPLGMITRDLDRDIERAVGAGARMRGEVIQFGPAKIAFVKTPEGHEIEMMQMQRSTAAAAVS